MLWNLSWTGKDLGKPPDKMCSFALILFTVYLCAARFWFLDYILEQVDLHGY